MPYIQLHEDGSYSANISEGTPIYWDSQNFCTVEALFFDSKAEQFRVYPLTAVSAPSHNAMTQMVRALDPAVVDGKWTQRWEVVNRYATPEEESAAVLANLLELKAAKRAEINAARLAANFSTFQHAGKAIACDQLSRSDIDGTNGFVSLYGTLPPGWPGGWKAVDNTYVAIPDIPAWKAFYGSMFAAGNANFVKAQTLKAQVDAATTAEEVAEIVW